MFNIGYFVVASLLLAMTQSTPLHAGTPSEYTVTLKKFELKDHSGQWVSVIEPDKPVNLVEAEAKVSFFNTTGRVPDGNYINFRMTLSETVRVQGRKGSNVTRAGGSVELTGSAVTHEDLPAKIEDFTEIAPSWADSGEPGLMQVRFSFNPRAGRDNKIRFTRKNDLTEPLLVRKGSFIYAIALIDIEDIVQYAQKHHFRQDVPKNPAMFAWPIQKIEEIKLTIDDRSIVMGPDEIAIEY